MNNTKKIEEILAQIPPKFLLDHYWNILDLINWGGFVNSKDKEYFTISDLEEKITEEINSPSNPFHLRLSLRSKEVIDKLSEKLKMNSSKLIPLYPSNDFVIGFVSKVSSINLQKLYSEYSHFIHSYFTSWHIFPFSSVLEFKIYKQQLQIFTDTLLRLMNYYFDLFSCEWNKGLKNQKEVE